ncbi:hypothetical protein [Fundicoccus culcitae]|uniref:Glutaredoxin n=1 Tax=Fundicoccus culcitae TaxID=2969821 RepID=A0ABY5P6A0_9LACT|nr:hypothetical protein [Fundicoccus culcitae]UUX33928.1 hypothetical protein NRE15_13745 [Fundicoccus culcitae]
MSGKILYFSSVCPDTPAFVAELERLNIAYTAVNITESMPNLKQFLALRDTRPEFDVKKEHNQVGVPVLKLENDALIFDVSELESQA